MLANFALPRLMRQELARQQFDVVLEDINKIPFYAPLYTDLPVVVMVPHLFGKTIFRETNPLFASYVIGFEWPLRFVYRHSLFSAASASTAADLRRRGIDASRIEVIHNGMDHSRYELTPPPPRNREPTLIHIGRLRRYKSVDVAVRAMAIVQAQLPTARLVVIGEGPEQSRLQSLARRLGVADAIEFRGYRPRSEIVDQLYRSHVLLQTSPKEGWGLTVIEANECRVPAVASRAPGLVDSVRDGETGLLARYGDAADFAAKALRLLADEALRLRMGEAAQRWARSFSWDAAASASEALLLRALAERSR
jgi:glycosyltransferase involved in cell wall biosynthesis